MLTCFSPHYVICAYVWVSHQAVSPWEYGADHLLFLSPHKVWNLVGCSVFSRCTSPNNFHPPAQSEPYPIPSSSCPIWLSSWVSINPSLPFAVLTSPEYSWVLLGKSQLLSPILFPHPSLGHFLRDCGLWPQKWFLVIQPLEKELERDQTSRPLNAFCSPKHLLIVVGLIELKNSWSVDRDIYEHSEVIVLIVTASICLALINDFLKELFCIT